MSEKFKRNIIIYVSAALFGIAGVYLTFFAGNISKYDSQTKAYKIYPNESYDSDSTMYKPIYYFKVDGRDYECMAKEGSSSYPNESKNTVYYDSADPTNCKTEYEKSTNTFAGVLCLIATIIIVYFFIIKGDSVKYNQIHDNELEGNTQLDKEKEEKIIGTIEKVQLIYKRIILGIIIVVLLIFILIDTAIFKQTIISRNYTETVATYVDKKNDSESEVYDDYLYEFVDKNGKRQEIIKSYPKDGSTTPDSEIKIKYNENNPEDYYEEGSTMDKSGIIWYIVKVVAFVLLLVLFFNRKLLSKVNISSSKR